MRRKSTVRMGVCGAVVALLAAAPLGAEPVRLKAAGIELARLAPLTYQVMTGELNALLATSRVSVEWRRAHPASETARDELRVVFLDSPGQGAHADGGVLAASGAHLPSPTVWVYTPAVVAALDPGIGSPLASLRAQRALGVALGRVLTHELVHLLAPEVPHGRGLMALCLRRGALIDPAASLDAASATALWEAAQEWQRRGGPPPEAEQRAWAPGARSDPDRAR